MDDTAKKSSFASRVAGRVRRKDPSGSHYRRELILFVSLLLASCGGGGGSAGVKTIILVDASPTEDNSPPLGTERGKANSANGQMASIAVSRDGQRVYAGGLVAGVWRSDDRGTHWKQMTSDQPGDDDGTCVDLAPTCGLPALHVSDLAVSPSNPDLVFAATNAADGSHNKMAGLYRSADGGRTWQFVWQCKGKMGEPQPVRSVTFAPDDETKLWAAGGCGVAYSEAASLETAGTVWSPAGFGSFGALIPPDLIVNVAAGPAQGDVRRVYACGPAVLYYSSNGGKTFYKDLGTPAAAGGICQDPAALGRVSAHALAVVPNQPEQVYVVNVSSPTGSVPAPLVVPPGTDYKGIFAAPVLVTYDASDASKTQGVWSFPYAPPMIPSDDGTGSGHGAVLAVPTPIPSQFMLIFSDRNNVHIANGHPSSQASWRRIDGYQLSAACPGGTGPNCNKNFLALKLPLHADPRAIAFAPDGYYDFLRDPLCFGSVFVVNDGGAFRTGNCGLNWVKSTDLATLGAINFAGLPGVDGDMAPPSLYFTTYDNNGWNSPNGGRTWKPFECGSDCDAIWSDPGQPNLVIAVSRDGGAILYDSNVPEPSIPTSDPPDLSVPAGPCGKIAKGAGTCFTDLGYPLTFGKASDKAPLGLAAIKAAGKFETWWKAAMDWGFQADRFMVRTTKAGARTPKGDFAMVAPTVNDPATKSFHVWRHYNGADWIPEGTGVPGSRLPEGATVLQSSGGHTDTVFYVGDRVGPTGAVTFALGSPGNRLFRSYRSRGGLTGWDCIVPGPPAGGDPSHSGACRSDRVVDDKHAGQAVQWVANPYNANVVYVLDKDNRVKVTVDGGVTWNVDLSLTKWLTRSGEVSSASCPGFEGAGVCYNHSPNVLTNMEFVEDEPHLHFAIGTEGVFVTWDGADQGGDILIGVVAAWHRLLDPRARGCRPRGMFFEHTHRIVRDLYVACDGRSILALRGIPTSFGDGFRVLDTERIPF